MNAQADRCAQSGSKSVLVVDDDESMQRALLRELRKFGYVAEACGTLGEALGRLASKHFDLVLLDLMLPDVKGDEGIERIRSGYFDTKVVVITGNPNFDTAFASGQLGVTKYLTKPLDLSEVISVVRQAVGMGAAHEAIDSAGNDNGGGRPE